MSIEEEIEMDNRPDNSGGYWAITCLTFIAICCASHLGTLGFLLATVLCLMAVGIGLGMLWRWFWDGPGDHMCFVLGLWRDRLYSGVARAIRAHRRHRHEAARRRMMPKRCWGQWPKRPRW